MPTKRNRVQNARNTSLMLYTSAFIVLGALIVAILITDPSAEGHALANAPAEGVATGSAFSPQPSDAPSSGVSVPSVAERPTVAAPSSAASVPIAHVDEGPAVVHRPTGKDQGKPLSKKSRGILIFVIDDAGHNTWQLEPFLALPWPITIAVLPGLPHTTSVVSMVKAAGKELLLHQPMEALNKLDAGPGVINIDMSASQIRQILRDNLAQVPGAVGINNHMGSKATSDVRVMSTILDETKTDKLYFLDSLTVGDSVVHSVASLMRQSTWERAVFLDNTPDKASILHYISEGTKIAEKRGYAVMIGHVWSAELAQTLSELYPQLIEQGFSLSTISRIMMDDDDDTGD